MANDTEKKFVPSPQQLQIFSFVEDNRRGNAIIEACPGAGKTTTLVKACEKMSGEVLFLVFNTKNAKETREKTGHMRNLWVKTFHAMGMSTLQYQFKNSDVRLREPDDKKVRKLIDQWIADNGRNDLTEMATSVAKIVSMAKQRGIGVCFPDNPSEWQAMIDHFDLANDLPDYAEKDYDTKIAQVVNMSRFMLRESTKQAREFGVIDFDDMVYLPLVWNLRLKRFPWVLVDEAQDTNPTRREMAKRMKEPSGRLIAVGDPHQAIYGFSGADNDSLDQIRRGFDALTMPLTVTYRCPKAVVDVARRYYSSITPHDSSPEGCYAELPYEALPAQLLPGDAVLCRYTKYLVSTCFRLIRNGQPARIEGRAIGAGLVKLARKWNVKKLDVLETRIRSWEEREVKKADEAKNERKVLEVQDKAETMYVLIARGTEQGVKDVDGLCDLIASMFDDNVADKTGMITLCSVHRSKGMEWQRVFILGLDELMGRECYLPWQTVQEVNLQWVAVTRAQNLLVNVTGVKEDPKPSEGGTAMTKDQATNWVGTL